MTNETLRILIVDDHRDTADALAWVLHSLGHQVQTAYDGVTALHMIDKRTPDVVLQDLQLPRMNGYQIAGHIRDRAAGRHVFVVAVSGHYQSEAGAANCRAFDLFMPKPVGLQALHEMLRTAASHCAALVHAAAPERAN
jgi:CheY-like chemotaxis protein